MEHLIYWIWLSLRCGAGSELGSYLLSQLGTPKAIYEASEKELLALEGVDRNIASALLDRDLTYANKILTYCERMNVGIVTLESEIYPERLRNIHAKPILLYYRGRFPDVDDNVLIACVGMRDCSKNGKENAYRLGYGLAEAGAIVVSGMARGIDAASQIGALDAGGHTIAVLGCGIDRAYPSENKELMERIAEKGTVITEFAPGTDPFGKNFPIRNRIISGLSQGTVVVEADERSGSLITAQDAIRQGRDVFAFPGDAVSANAAGTNMLIQDGAKLVTSAFDVVIEYEPLYPHRIMTEKLLMVGRRAKVQEAYTKMEQTAAPERYTRKKKERFETPKAKIKVVEPKKETRTVDTSALSETEALVFSVMNGEMSPEDISSAISASAGKHIPVGELLGILTMLEIGGYVEALPGGSFQRI